MSKFSFRRKDRAAFKHIAHGLIPAATIAPRPAVPRTPPPRSPYPSPERPRSALAAAILSSSLTGRTVAIPPARQRSFSESDCSFSASRVVGEPYASTAEYTRDKWHEPLPGRPRLPSPAPSDEYGVVDDDDGDDDDEDNEEQERELLSHQEEEHIYQSLERQSTPVQGVYALPFKQGAGCSEISDASHDSPLEGSSCRHAGDQAVESKGTGDKPYSSKVEQEPPVQKATETADLGDKAGSASPSAQLVSQRKKRKPLMDGSVTDGPSDADRVHRDLLDKHEESEALTQSEEAREMNLERLLGHAGASGDKSRIKTESKSDLQMLQHQAQELVYENDALKQTVHRLSTELSRYQQRFRPPSQEESSKINGLPQKGLTPPCRVDKKSLSALVLSYEDQLTQKDSLMQAHEEEMKKLRQRVEELVQENQTLQQGNTGVVGQKEWRQLKDQARLVLKENRGLMEQLEVQQVKAKESHSRHRREVTKVSKQLMQLEAEKQQLQDELEATRGELQALQAQHRQAAATLQCSVSQEEYHTVLAGLKRQLVQKEERNRNELEDVRVQLASLQGENSALLLDKTQLAAQAKSLETELEASRHSLRKAQRRIGLLSTQVEDSVEKEAMAQQQLAGVVALAEKTAHERDHLIHVASLLEKDKEGALTKVIEDTMRLSKLQEKVKVYKKQTCASLGALGHQLQEQEEEFAGRAAAYKSQIRRLQQMLRDKQEALDGALRQKRELEEELETVWESTSRENQRIKEALYQTYGRAEQPLTPLVELHPAQLQSSTSVSPHHVKVASGLHRSPMFESDSEPQQNPSSDESEKTGLDFYS